MGLRIKTDTTKYIITSKDNRWVQVKYIQVEEIILKRVKRFKYLGFIIADDGDTSHDTKKRITKNYL